MKNFHQNLLILLAISLCALCVWQWYGQTVQRKRIENLDVILTKKSGDIQSYTNSIDTLNHQLEEMDARITELKTAATAQDQTNLAQKREIARLKLTTEILTNQLSIHECRDIIGRPAADLRRRGEAPKRGDSKAHHTAG